MNADRWNKERQFEYGQKVIFNPPNGAYSKQSKQYHVSGRVGFVGQGTTTYSDVTFTPFMNEFIIINNDYLQAI